MNLGNLVGKLKHLIMFKHASQLPNLIYFEFSLILNAFLNFSACYILKYYFINVFSLKILEYSQTLLT